jgi:hypothetical protein
MSCAVSISTMLNPGDKKTLSILFAWYFPHHYWLDLPLDDYYLIMQQRLDNPLVLTKMRRH